MVELAYEKKASPRYLNNGIFNYCCYTNLATLQHGNTDRIGISFISWTVKLVGKLSQWKKLFQTEYKLQLKKFA